MIKKASFNIFLGVVACSQACICCVNAKALLKQTINHHALQDGQLKCEINDFGPPKHDPNLPVGKQTIYDFNLDIYMTGWYYNFWAETLKIIGLNPSVDLRKKFFDEFLGPQGAVYPYLFTWSSFIAGLRDKLKEKAKEVADMSYVTKKYFLSKLSIAFSRNLLFFNWFENIFLVDDIEPYYHPIYPINVNTRDYFVTELREKGAILRIPLVSSFFYDPEHKPCVEWSVGANMQMFPQDETLIDHTSLLSYFYTAPENAYAVELFDKIWPTIKIKLDPEQPLIINNQNSIFKALRAIMHITISPAELPAYLALDPTTDQRQVTDEPVLFTVDFLQTGAPHETVYTKQWFYVQGTN